MPIGFRAIFHREKGLSITTGKKYYLFWVRYRVENSEQDRNTFVTNPIIQGVFKGKKTIPETTTHSGGGIRFVIDRDTARMDHPIGKNFPDGKGIGQLLDAKAIQLLHQNVKRIRFIQRGPRKMPINDLLRFYGWKISRDSFRKNPTTRTYPVKRIKEIRKRIMKRRVSI